MLLSKVCIYVLGEFYHNGLKISLTYYMNIDNLVLIIPVFGALALVFTWWKTKQINAHSEGTPRMAKIASSIQEGAI